MFLTGTAYIEKIWDPLVNETKKQLKYTTPFFLLWNGSS